MGSRQPTIEVDPGFGTRGTIPGCASLRDFCSGAYTHYFAAYRLYGKSLRGPR